MKKVLFILSFVLLLGGCTATNTERQTTNNKQHEAHEAYYEYTPEVLERELKKDGPTFLFFHAKWCPTCVQLDREIKRSAKVIPDDWKIINANFDTERELRKKYDVTIQHTLVALDNDGTVIKKWIGGGVDVMKQMMGVNEQQTINNEQESKGTSEQKTVINHDVPLADDFSTAKVKENELIQGCFIGKDCIPSIENPTFEKASDANWMRDDDVVFAINYKGVQRAYPQRILNWHEIVNDMIAGDPIAITFCPLCGSAVGFERVINGIVTELGVSGKLHESDLVMYDRYEGNLWQQITGEAIVGKAAERNEVLKQVPIVTTTWGEWKKSFPQTDVLSKETGFVRDYDRYPYGTYESDEEIYFGVQNLDQSLPAKEVIYGIKIGDTAKAYTEKAIDREGTISDTVAGVALTVTKDASGTVTITKENGETMIPIRLFWFAWATFNPDTLVFK